MLKFLVIGLAPYIVSWFDKWGKKTLNKGFKLVAINNAWQVSPDDITYWMKGNDFKDMGNKRPIFSMSRQWEIKEKLRLEEPYFYKKKGSGIMILNVLCNLLNISIQKSQKCIVAVAGCDCVYTGKNDHFYGKGKPDPMRYGRKWLLNELLRIKDFYKREESQLYNIGGQEETILPFEQISPEEL